MTIKLKTSDLVDSISKLELNKPYLYYSGNTQIKITEIVKPEGHISFVRWKKGLPESSAGRGSISIPQLATVASVFSSKPNYPIHLDRLFSAGGNSRSALETLLALTPNFFICYPQRTNPYTGELENKERHLMWRPNQSHNSGEFKLISYSFIISTIEVCVTPKTDVSETDDSNKKAIDSFMASFLHNYN